MSNPRPSRDVLSLSLAAGCGKRLRSLIGGELKLISRLRLCVYSRAHVCVCVCVCRLSHVSGYPVVPDGRRVFFFLLLLFFFKSDKALSDMSAEIVSETVFLGIAGIHRKHYKNISSYFIRSAPAPAPFSLPSPPRNLPPFSKLSSHPLLSLLVPPSGCSEVSSSIWRFFPPSLSFYPFLAAT